MTAGTRAASSSSRTRSALACVRTSTAMCRGQIGSSPTGVAVRARGARSPRPRRAARRRRRRGRGRRARGPRVPGRTRCRSARSSARRGARRARAARRRSERRSAAGVRCAGVGPDLAVDDPLVTEPRVGEQRVVGVEQGLVAAAVDRAASRASRAICAPPRGTRRRRRRGTRRSPAWDRRPARASRPESRTHGRGSATGSDRCPGTRRPAPRRNGSAAVRVAAGPLGAAQRVWFSRVSRSS